MTYSAYCENLENSIKLLIGAKHVQLYEKSGSGIKAKSRIFVSSNCARVPRTKTFVKALYDEMKDERTNSIKKWYI